jgi:hypothetical protein
MPELLGSAIVETQWNMIPQMGIQLKQIRLQARVKAWSKRKRKHGSFLSKQINAVRKFTSAALQSVFQDDVKTVCAWLQLCICC